MPEGFAALESTVFLLCHVRMIKEAFVVDIGQTNTVAHVRQHTRIDTDKPCEGFLPRACRLRGMRMFLVILGLALASSLCHARSSLVMVVARISRHHEKLVLIL